ncbi:hypothetical protein U9M48_015390 [Paspalum notatum var. saurae]|uniref:Ubiquitin-like protease family profile domain-containing protein n=1 Tax=Paspalum notatum var. saurae TaxID=547442 RepID=A0AAQ3WLH3_PASNO
MVGPGLTVGGWFAGAVIKKFVDKVRSIMEDSHALQAEADNMLYSVLAALPRIQILVEVTERKPISSLSYANWLQQFKDVVSEAEDLLDDLETKRIQDLLLKKKNKVSSAASFALRFARNFVLSDKDLKRLKDVLIKLNKIISDDDRNGDVKDSGTLEGNSNDCNLNSSGSSAHESDSNRNSDDDVRDVADKLYSERKKVKKLKNILKKILKADGKEIQEKFGKFSKDAFTRFSVKTFASVIDSLDDHQKSVIRKYGFGVLLEFQKCFVPNKFAKWLARHVNLESGDIVVKGKAVSLTPESVHLVLGLPIGGAPFPRDSSSAKSKILSRIGKSSMPQVNFFANKLINKDPMSDEDIFICFMIVALNSFLCPNSSLVPSSSYLGVFDNVEKAKEFNWSKYILDWLFVKVKEFTRDKSKATNVSQSKTLGGCLYYLAVIYLDSLDFGDRQVLGGIPRIGVWKGNMIKSYCSLDSEWPGQYGVRPILDASKTCFAKHVMQTTSHCTSLTPISDFTFQLHELCGDKLPDDLCNEISNLVANFTCGSSTRVILDEFSSIGPLSDKFKQTFSALLNQYSNIDTRVQKLVLSVLKLCFENGMAYHHDDPSAIGTKANATEAMEAGGNEDNVATPNYFETLSVQRASHGLDESAQARMKARSAVCMSYKTQSEIARLRNPIDIISDDDDICRMKRVHATRYQERGNNSNDVIYLDSENTCSPDTLPQSTGFTFPRYCTQKPQQSSIRNPLTPIHVNLLDGYSGCSQRITQILTDKSYTPSDNNMTINQTAAFRQNQVSPDVQFIGQKNLSSGVRVTTNKADITYKAKLCGKMGPYGPRRLIKPTSIMKTAYESNKSSWQVTSSEYDNYEAICEITSSQWSNENAVDLGGVWCTFWALGQSLMPRGSVNNYVIATFCRHLFLKPNGHPEMSKRHYFFPSISCNYSVLTLHLLCFLLVQFTDNLLKDVNEADQEVLMRAFTMSTKTRPLQNSNLLFFPTCYQNHWFVFIVDIKDQCFVFLDSHYNPQDEFHNYVRERSIHSFATHWAKYIQIEKPFGHYDILYPDIPKHNTEKMYDSGIYAMMGLQHWTSPRTILSSIFQPKDCAKIRVKIANELVLSPRNNGRKDIVALFQSQGNNLAP